MENIFIILPVFNGEKYILEQLISIYNQTRTNWKLIFINDYSSDESVNIIKKFAVDYDLK
jgi:rhamnosyltransferase